MRIGTAEHDSTFHAQGLALKALLERNAALAPVEICLSRHASVENAEALERGAIEFGFMASNWIGRAARGERPFAAPIELRMAAPMNAGPLFFIARADSPLASIDQLRGRRVAVGLPQSGMIQHARRILGALGLSFEDITALPLDFAAGAEALLAGDADAQFQCPIPNKVMTALTARTALRVLAYPAGALERVLAALSDYRPTIMRRGALRGLDEASPQLAVLNVLVTHARIEPALVEAVAAAILAGAAALERMEPLFRGLPELFQPLRAEGAAALEFGRVSLHEGARRAYHAGGYIG